MGGWLAKLLGGTREMRILMVGLDAAGAFKSDTSLYLS